MIITFIDKISIRFFVLLREYSLNLQMVKIEQGMVTAQKKVVFWIVAGTWDRVGVDNIFEPEGLVAEAAETTDVTA